MKILIFISIFFCIIVMPARAELTSEDLNKIRLIVKEEIEQELSIFETRIKEYVDIRFESVDTQFKSIDKQFEGVDTQFEGVDKQFEGVDKQFEGVAERFESVDNQIMHVTYVTYGLIALIVAAIGIPQIIMAWRSEQDRDQTKQIQELRQEIEILKQRQIIRP